MVKKIDLLKHVLVPPCSKLTEEEKEQILEKHNISILQLPKILSKDPLAKTLKAKKDDVIKIEHKTPTGKTTFYRRVI
ncbi:DNA-directed RNA polymerase subunit H [Candidatus Woesearchaeota archaeon]|nr:DNA-directed RNA polymerase subunit H [Candidatus Woesearchaeota archaeon]